VVRRKVVVSGRVQGVFFRASCRDEAKSAGVAGWVSNEPDGTVKAVFEGEADAVDQMIAWCHQGPPQADVDDVTVTEEQPEGLQGFESR
jgi:acylphosphatase